ncbi:MAG: divalent-cation tolerance protein CutA [Candidatus Poseidoniaceae archaeon]
MSSKIWVIKTTLPESMNDEEVASFANALIEAGAACIQHHKVTSTYKWEDEMKSESEWSIQIKVSKQSKQAVADLLAESHPYDVPQIIIKKWEASDDYLNWINLEN